MGNEISCKMKLLIASGSRADYGHLKSLLAALSNQQDLDFGLLVTGTHLSDKFGYTIDEIKKDNYSIEKKIPVDLTVDSISALSKAMSDVINQTLEYLSTNKPDALIVYADRWEMFGIATAATLCGIPLIHIGGGDTTEGAYDESFRHSITKMSHLHFVTHELARTRVIQLGENPKDVHNVGSLAIDSIKATTLLSKNELESSLNFKFQEKNILVTYHPTTLNLDAKNEITSVLSALRQLSEQIGIIITQPSFDAGSLQIIPELEKFVEQRKNSILVSSLGLQRYLSCVNIVNLVVGNSSSGIYEVPYFNKQTINIGDRQKGRCKASSVIDVPVESKKIFDSINNSIELNISGTINPYGDGTAAKEIVRILLQYKNSGFKLKKTFHFIKL
jgi:GDP/UDP-N,N'-diacetylbacillosamine 2-epimerase (hydrolysing)